jgi:2-aminoadipate transaminase
MTTDERVMENTGLDWHSLYAQRTHRMANSAIRELLKVTEQPDFISFAGGMPAPEVFPVDEVRAVGDRILRDAGPTALQYGRTEGYGPLRQLIAQQMTNEGIPCTSDNILITTGSQQAIDLLGKIFIDLDDRVVMESPTYLATIQAWNSYGASYVGVDSDDDGIVTEHLEGTLQSGDKLLYCLPNFQNPGGVTLSAERRRDVVELAMTRGVPIVEDDPYRELRFEGEHLRRLIDIDSENRSEGGAVYRGSVMYLSTFSKTLAPGLRIGWVVAAPEVISELTMAKQGVDLHTAMFNQMIAYELSASGFLDRHSRDIIRAYKERRDTMLVAMEEYFPSNVRWTRPQGGMFLWVTLPDGMNAAAVLQDAIPHRVAFVPGAPFHPTGGGENTFRLNFSNASPDKIRLGIERLGEVLQQRAGESPRR